MIKIKPILLEVFKNRFSSIAEEMGVTLQRTAFSPNIKERMDFSCAIFDHAGEMIAQAAHIPVHLGSLPMSVNAAMACTRWEEGDMVFLNDPYQGGSHLPDITIIAPVFATADHPSFFVANRAHHADVGGMSSGSMPIASSIFQEGIIIPPIKLVSKGNLDQQIMSLFLRNVRTPSERKGDFDAQIMANRTGVKRVLELIEKYTIQQVETYANGLIDYAEKIMRRTIKDIPDGIYEFKDFLDDDGLGNQNLPIQVSIIIRANEAVIDFTNSGRQTKGSVNAVFSITLSAVLYVFRSLVAQDIPANSGCLKPLKIITRKGSIVDAQFPAAVAGGNVETSQRIVDVLLGALFKALPDRIPAASQGTMNNLSLGGIDPESNVSFAYYETIAGGMGASASFEGERGVHSHMTNTLNTPIEALEYSYPLLITEYSLRKGSGGNGFHKGGDGLVREMQLLADADVTVLSERRTRAPYGFLEGEPGEKGKNIVISSEGTKEVKGGKFSASLREKDILRIETPGGGGFGRKK